ncbi:MAG TPA: hypothetical protein VLH38_03910 [Patescibacteria group bacterium]|nr:hypothetical protein [Patescibacteria group bacterium]
MRTHLRPAVLLPVVRGAVLAATTTYILQPLTAHAATVQVCRAAGDACSKFVNKYINPAILLLTLLVGIAAVISILVAAIQYSSAGDDPAALNKAKDRIFQTVIGIIAYLFLFAFLNYVVPGGLF